MKEELQIIELAKLDGDRFTPNHAENFYNAWRGSPFLEIKLKRHGLNYRTSYDAIIPLIRKQYELSFRVRFLNELRTILQRDLGKNAISDFDMLTAAPAQMSECVLRATGRWQE